MESLRRFGGTAGVLIALAGTGIVWFVPEQKTWGWALAGLGVLLAIAGAVLNAGEFRNVLRGRPFRHGTNAVFYSLIVLGIVMAVAWLAARHNKRFDMTPQGAYSLSPQTRKILEGLDQDVSMVAFFTPGLSGRQKATDLLDEYKQLSDRLTVRVINPTRNPAEARAYGVEYDGTVIVSAGSGEARVTPSFQTALTEQELTNAIIKAVSTDKKTICLSTGHGEKAMDKADEGGWQQAAESLRKENFEVSTVRLLDPGALEACSSLVIAGPSHALLAPEADAVKAYVDKGGRLLVMLEPRITSGLEELLQAYGLKVGEDFVVDVNPMARLMGGQYNVPVVYDYGPGPITKDFQGLITVFPLVRSIETVTATEPNVTTEVLARTTEQSWAETGPFNVLPEHDASERVGPLAVAASASRSLEGNGATSSDPNVPESDGDPGSQGKQARLVVFGDVDFSSNQAIGLGGNRDLLLNSIQWLNERSDLISVRPKSTAGQPLILTGLQGRLVWFYSLLLFPALLAMAGFGVYLRRRRL
jgi:ABC-type uncharacterized transport system involved in gliding motility auxiliary subunit